MTFTWKRFGLFLLASAALGALLGLLGGVLDLSPGVRGGLIGALIPCIWLIGRGRRPAPDAKRATDAR